MSKDLTLPTTGDPSNWTDQEKAMVEAAGLVDHGRLAPRPTVEAYLAHCRRTGLDPIARQIYAICRKGRWGIQVSIDGARLIAERSGKYAGQTPVEWTGDGVTWTQVWLDQKPPAAARVGVYRSDFKQPMYAVANFSAYNAGGPMWSKMPALMIGKCAEMLALRRAFPQDLSGLYSAEEMDQAHRDDAPRAQEETVEAEVIDEEPDVQRQWVDAIHAAQDRDELMRLWEDAKSKRVPNLRPVFEQRARDLQAAA